MKILRDSAYFDLDLGTIRLNAVQAGYTNTQSGQELVAVISQLLLDSKKFDLKKQKVELKTLALHNSKIQYTQNKIAAKDTVRSGENPETEIQLNWTVTSKQIDLQNNTFIYNDKNTLPLKNQLDLKHLQVNSLSLRAKDVHFNPEKIDLELKDLHFTEKSGLVLKKFRGKINYDSTHAEISELDLQFNNSRISNHLALTYSSIQSLKDSLKSLGLTAEFKKTHIAVQDILYFYPDLFKILALKEENKNATLNLSGKINGKLDELVFSKLEVQTKATSIQLDGKLDKVMDPKTTYASMFFNIRSTKKDLMSFIPDSLIPKTINLPDTFSLKGSFKGYAKNFNAEATLHTSFGNLLAKVEMNPKAGNKEQPYQGTLDLKGFDLGRLVNSPKDIGKITMNAKIKGSGFDTSNIDAAMHLHIASAIYKNYEYKDFNLDGDLRKKSFHGKAGIKDENLNFDFTGGFDLEPAHPKYTFTLNLVGADLKALNLSEEDVRVSAIVESDIGNEPGRNATGRASIHDALIIRKNKKYPVDSIVLTSEYKDGISDVKLRSEIMSADFKGEIVLSELTSNLKQHLNSYFNMQDGIANEKLPRQKIYLCNKNF